MEKPYTIIINEFEEKIVKVVNESNLPPYVMLKVLESIIGQIEKIDQENVSNYLLQEAKKQEKKTRGDK